MVIIMLMEMKMEMEDRVWSDGVWRVALVASELS